MAIALRPHICDVTSPYLYWNGWPSSSGQATSVFHQAIEANSASYHQWDGKWVPAKVRWYSAAGEVGLIPPVDKTCGWQVKLYDPSLTRAVPECFSDESW